MKDTEAKSKETEHKFQYLKPYHGPAQHCFLMEAKKFQIGCKWLKFEFIYKHEME